MGTENIITTDSLDHQQQSSSFSTPNHDDVVNVSVTIQENDVIGGAQKVLEHIRPSWNADHIKFKVKEKNNPSYYQFLNILSYNHTTYYNFTTLKD